MPFILMKSYSLKVSADASHSEKVHKKPSLREQLLKATRNTFLQSRVHIHTYTYAIIEENPFRQFSCSIHARLILLMEIFGIYSKRFDYSITFCVTENLTTDELIA